MEVDSIQEECVSTETTEGKRQPLAKLEVNSTKEEDSLDKNIVPESIKKRGRGRPSRKMLEARLKEKGNIATRASARLKEFLKETETVHKKTRGFSGRACVWSNDEKRDFLRALQTCGVDDLGCLKQHLPGKNENEIRNQIKMWKNFAQKDLEKRLLLEKKKVDSATVNSVSKLDEWSQYFEEVAEISSPRLFALSNVFLLIAEYAKFPRSSDCNGIDFRAVYRYIHCILNGIPYYGMNQPTARVVGQSILDMFAMLRELRIVHSLQPHLYTNLKFQMRCPNYGRPANWTLDATKSNPELICALPDLNPLNLAPHILSKPDLNGDDEDEEEEEEYSTMEI